MSSTAIGRPGQRTLGLIDTLAYRLGRALVAWAERPGRAGSALRARLLDPAPFERTREARESVRAAEPFALRHWIR